ncbi:DUF190 domain-containing protein [Dyella sp.]|uniref:DUF190 domain-containing protein n=1 Tax=Dyella sp. TaxID=1869338 RepID=UPI002ED30BA4
MGCVRLYFPEWTRANRSRLWHHLSAPALAHHLLRVARRDGIEQAILHRVMAGYLKGQRVRHYHPETAGMDHPQCLELIDRRERLESFLSSHAEELRKVRLVILSVALPSQVQA